MLLFQQTIFIFFQNQLCTESHDLYSKSIDRVPSRSTGALVLVLLEPVHFGKILKAKHQIAKGTTGRNTTALGNQKCLQLPPRLHRNAQWSVHLETGTCHFFFQEEVRDAVESLQCAVVVFSEGKRHVRNCVHHPVWEMCGYKRGTWKPCLLLKVQWYHPPSLSFSLSLMWSTGAGKANH